MEMLSSAQKHVGYIVLIKISKVFARYWAWADNRLFSLNLKQDLTVVFCSCYKNNFFAQLVCAHPRHGWC